jgi:hypothetical protein
MPKAQIRYSNSSEKVEKSHNFNKTERVSVMSVLSSKAIQPAFYDLPLFEGKNKLFHLVR